MSNSKVISNENYLPRRKSKYEMPSQAEIEVIRGMERETREELKKDFQRQLGTSFFIQSLFWDDICLLSEVVNENEKFSIEELKNIKKTTISRLAIFGRVTGVEQS